MKNLIFLFFIAFVVNIYGQSIGTSIKNATVDINFTKQNELDFMLKDSSIEARKLSIYDSSIVRRRSKNVEVIKLTIKEYPTILRYYIPYPKNFRRVSIYIDNKKRKFRDSNIAIFADDLEIYQGIIVGIERKNKNTQEIKMTSIVIDDEYVVCIVTKDS